MAVSSVPWLGKLWANTWDNSTDLVAFCDGRNLVDKGRAILVSCAWTCAFGTVPQGVPVSKLETWEFMDGALSGAGTGWMGALQEWQSVAPCPVTRGILRAGDWDWPEVPVTPSARISPWHCCATLQGSVQGTVQEIVLEPKLLLKPLLKVFGLGC